MEKLTDRLFKILLLALLFLTGAPHREANSEPIGVQEYEVKAAFLYNFAQFAEWPEESLKDKSQFIIGVIGEDPFGAILDEVLAGKSIREKPIVVKRTDSIEDAKHFQLLFISSSEEKHLKRIFRDLKNAPILTVSDIGQFVDEGGMIEMIKEKRRIQFDVNVDALSASNLRISSQVLKLAKVIVETPKDPELPK